MPGISIHSGNIMKKIPAFKQTSPREEITGSIARGSCDRVEEVPSHVAVTAKLFLAADADPQYIRSAVEDTLKSLNKSSVDLLLVSLAGSTLKHSDDISFFKPMWAVMEEVHNEGVASRIGVCDFSRPQLEQLISFAKVKPAANQVHLGDMEDDTLVEFASDAEVSLLSHGPSDRDAIPSPRDLSEALKEQFGEDKTPSAPWVVRYSAVNKAWGSATHRGYVVHVVA
eukprot:GFYU01000367.1.p1 GENE.GFYU01000367.1~~GFYU01000367.1.p1  ORF type:complete len:227 (-),score=68.80 GFYU01000367.1:294-974(-)